MCSSLNAIFFFFFFLCVFGGGGGGGVFRVNIVPYSNCSYGVLVENVEHYLFECTL